MDNAALIEIAKRQGLQYDEEYGEFWRASAHKETHLALPAERTYEPPPHTEPRVVYQSKPPRRSGNFLPGLLKAVLIICSCGVLLIFFVLAELVKNSSRKSPKPHYGYRYGRWYYGTGHRRGCQDPSQDPHCRK